MLYANLEVNRLFNLAIELDDLEYSIYFRVLIKILMQNGSISYSDITIRNYLKHPEKKDAVEYVLGQYFYKDDDGNWRHEYTDEVIDRTLERSEKARQSVRKRYERTTNVVLASSDDVLLKEKRKKIKDNNPLYIPNGIYAPPTGGAHPSDDFDDDLGEYDDDTDNDDSYCGNDAPQRAPSGSNSASDALDDELSVDAISDEKNGTSDEVAPTVQKAKKSKSGLPVRPDFISEQDWASVPMQAWKDWLDYRKSQKKPLTASAWNLFQSVANNANITLGQAVGLVAAKGWLSIKAEYKEVQEMRGIVSNDTVRSFTSREDSKPKLDIEQSGRTVTRSRGDYSDMSDEEYKDYLERNPSVYRIEKSIVPKVPDVEGQLTADDAERLGLSPDSLQKCLRYRKEMGQATTEKTIEFFKQVAQEKDVPLAAVLGVRNSAQNVNAPA